MEKISVAGLTILPKYDILKRNKGKEVLVGNTKISEEVVTYLKVGDHTTNMPASVYFGSKKAGRYTLNEYLKYAYDVMENITKITENGELVARYAYDKLNRLVREDNRAFGKTWLFTYDNNGNIVSKRETEFTLKANVEENLFTTSAYEYAGDKLLSYKGETFVYDEVGNPTTYRGKTATWTMGRRLTSYNGHTFTYDAMGRRLTKDGISFSYDSNGRLMKQSNGLEFIYDHTGVVGFTYGNNTYIYRKDVQGNIIAILNSSGVVVVKYEYDAWGNHGIEVLDSTCETLANLNPFRYRSYYYDTETELYFLKTRYYDPEIGRFMSIDGIRYLSQKTINGLNLYGYCGNNPVMYVDYDGCFAALAIGALIVFGGAILLLATSDVKPTNAMKQEAKDAAKNAKYEIKELDNGQVTVHIKVDTNDSAQSFDSRVSNIYYQELYNQSIIYLEKANFSVENAILMDVEHIKWEYEWHIAVKGIFENVDIIDLNYDETKGSMIKRGIETLWRKIWE